MTNKTHSATAAAVADDVIRFLREDSLTLADLVVAANPEIAALYDSDQCRGVPCSSSCGWGRAADMQERAEAETIDAIARPLRAFLVPLLEGAVARHETRL